MASQERRQKQQQLDFLLDSALDQLDQTDSDEDDSDSNNNYDNHDEITVCDNADKPGMGILTTANTKTKVSATDDVTVATNFSHDEVYSTQIEQSAVKKSGLSEQQQRQSPRYYGPEPPPKRDHGITPRSAFESISRTSLSEEESAMTASLEGMMQQFINANHNNDFNINNSYKLSNSNRDKKKVLNEDGSNGLADIEQAEKDLDDIFNKMMTIMEPKTVDTSTNVALVDRAKTTKSNVKSVTKNMTNCNSTDSGADASTGASAAKKLTSKSMKKKSKKKEEVDMDQTITNILDRINHTTSTNSGNNNNNHTLDPSTTSQLEQFSEHMMSTLMSDFEKMNASQDSNALIDTVMKQLLDKDIMYTPMKEVCLRFPAWLASNKSTLKEEEYLRYGSQYQYFQKIVRVYETDPQDFERLMELMQDIQEYGQPPADIIKDLAPGLEFDEEGLPIMNPFESGNGMVPPIPGFNMPGLGDNQPCCLS